MSEGPTRRFFDVWSRVYDLPLVQLATYRPVHTALLDALRSRPPATVLDVGCGTGQLAQRITAAFPGARVIGCDFSAGMLERASARSAPVRGGATRIAWVRSDAMRLPIRAASVDAVVCTEAFHWFPDQAAALCEFHRVLAPGGRLLLALVNAPAVAVTELTHLASRVVGQPLYWPTPSQMRTSIRAAGLLVDRQRRVFRLSGFLLPPFLTEAHRP